jgi:ectoine hydroxylase
MNRSGPLATLEPAAVESYRRDGYYIHRGFFDRPVAEAAGQWLKDQDQERLAKSWTEQEPGVPLAVFAGVHTGDHPIAALARHPRLLDMAGELMGEAVYIWASKVNVKAAWCGTAEYYHQDLVYWKDRGYPRTDMLSAMILLDSHAMRNAALHVVPGSHQRGFIEHMPFININGLAKYMVPPASMDALYRKNGLLTVEGEPGDVMFFHAALVHGSSHNISPHSRMIILSQLNTVGNEPVDVLSNAREFNLRRADFELREAERRLAWFTRKHHDQLTSAEPTFTAPIPEEERRALGGDGTPAGA